VTRDPAWEPVPDARPMHRLGDSVNELARSLGMRQPDAFARVHAAWPEVVGAAVAAATRPTAVRDGTVTVEVDGPEWATQLRYLEEQLVAVLTERVGAGIVARLRFQVARPT
jgi:predicted nucleic acid-binding Zn ribbon protein